jgi:hypothetical protein
MTRWGLGSIGTSRATGLQPQCLRAAGDRHSRCGSPASSGQSGTDRPVAAPTLRRRPASPCFRPAAAAASARAARSGRPTTPRCRRSRAAAPTWSRGCQGLAGFPHPIGRSPLDGVRGNRSFERLALDESPLDDRGAARLSYRLEPILPDNSRPGRGLS